MSKDTFEVPVFIGSKLAATLTTPKLLQELDHGSPIPENHGVIRILLPEHGDKRFAWNPRSIPEINEARDFFNQCVSEGLIPYEVGTGGNASANTMSEFDPGAGEVIFLPVRAVAGG